MNILRERLRECVFDIVNEVARGETARQPATDAALAAEPPKEEGMMAIPRYEYYTPPVWDKDSELRVHPDGDWVRYDDHLAEVRERERAAWMNHAEWVYNTLATTGRMPSRDDAKAEAKRRYGGEA